MVKTHCLPILTYAIESLPVQKFQINQMNVCWNPVYRSIFKFNKWEPVKNLILYLGRLNFKSIYDQCLIMFYKGNIGKINVDTDFCHIMNKFENDPKIINLYNRHGVLLSWSKNKIKKTIYDNFNVKLIISSNL